MMLVPSHIWAELGNLIAQAARVLNRVEVLVNEKIAAEREK